MLHVHLGHEHYRTNAADRELLDVIATSNLIGNEIQVVIACVQGSCTIVDRHSVLTINHGGKFGNNLYRLQELVNLNCLIGRAALYITIKGNARNLYFLLSIVIIAIARCSGKQECQSC